MLRVLRRKGVAKKVLWVLAIMITVSFVFFGISSSLVRQENTVSYAGKIFGRKVSFREFEDAFLHARHQAILRYGENFSKVERQLDLENEAWERLILLFEAKKRRITVPNSDVVAAIKKFSFFQRNGSFDKQLYEQIVQYVFRCTPRDFEEGIRETLVFGKLYDQETLKVDVSDEQVLKAYAAENEKVQIDYMVFPFEQYAKDIAPSQDSLRSYYDQNQNAFRLSPMININYLFVEYPPESSRENGLALSQKVKEITEAVETGEKNLQQLAEQYQLPIQESGFFSAEDPNLSLGWPLEVFQKALYLKKGELKTITVEAKGCYVLSLKETQDARLLSFEEAKEKVGEILIKEGAKNMAREKANEIRGQVLEALAANPKETLEAIAKRFNIKVEKTPEFSRSQYLPGVGPSAQFHQAAFGLTDQDPVSAPVEISGGFALLRLGAFVEADKEKFEKDKAFLKERLKAKLRDQAFDAFLSQLRQKAKLVNNIKKSSQELP